MKKLKFVADSIGVTKMTLWNWKYQGKIEFHKIGSMNYISDEDFLKLKGEKLEKIECVAIYARVSSTENKSNLETQRDRLISYCNAKGYKVNHIITEFGSGLNDSRPKLEKLILNTGVTKIVVEHKDRLTRFGFNYIEKLLIRCGVQLEVVNPVLNEKDDLIQDFVSVITSFSARIYGQRRSKRKTKQIIRDLENNK
jgi:predicted site-specific integrase-resolvase